MAKWLKKKDNEAVTEQGEMSFLDHLEELRWHIIKSLIAILLVAIFGMIFKTFLFDYIIFAPIKDWFNSGIPLCVLSILVIYKTRSL